NKTANLVEGTNTITIIATDKAGNKTTKTITITYNPPAKTIVITLKPGNPYMTVNGVSQEIDPGRGTKPVIIPKWSRTVVPIRAIVEALGGTIEWDGKERKVTIKFNGTVIELWIDNPEARVNGKVKWIDEKNHDVRPIIINDRTMLPLRFVAENLGCNVDWDPKTRTITITYIP
ncbi:MAG: copper amine oxidase N-terminal domain-containing protein, partial [Caldisericaceae bacterium]|nr:copper amine oxidase N-terminal domain-containing protein [Caldisericaceae bacterium]